MQPEANSFLVTAGLVPPMLWYSQFAYNSHSITYYYILVHMFPVLISMVISLSRLIWVSKKKIREKRWQWTPRGHSFDRWLSTWTCPIWHPVQQNIHISSMTLQKNLEIIPDTRQLSCLTACSQIFSPYSVFNLYYFFLASLTKY